MIAIKWPRRRQCTLPGPSTPQQLETLPTDRTNWEQGATKETIESHDLRDNLICLSAPSLQHPTP